MKTTTIEILDEKIRKMKQEFHSEITSLKWDIWKLENPPKYKPGDKVVVEILQNDKGERKSQDGIIINYPYPTIFFHEKYWSYQVLINNQTVSIGSHWIKQRS